MIKRLNKIMIKKILQKIKNIFTLKENSYFRYYNGKSNLAIFCDNQIITEQRLIASKMYEITKN